MAEEQVRYYILFANYEQGLALHDLLDRENIPNRIAPAPRAIQGELSCGMSLLIQPEALETVKDCIRRHNAPTTPSCLWRVRSSPAGTGTAETLFTASPKFKI